MLVFGIIPGHEIMVRHHGGDTMFVRPLYFPEENRADLGIIQNHSDFLVREIAPEHDLGRFRIIHRQTGEFATVMISLPKTGRHTGWRLDVAFDDTARNFGFFRPEMWKRKYRTLIRENAA